MFVFLSLLIKKNTNAGHHDTEKAIDRNYVLTKTPKQDNNKI